MLNLKILPVNSYYWTNHPTYNIALKNEDVGLDIPMQKNINIPKKVKAHKIYLGFKTEASHGYMIIPRSSLTKTPLRLANSIGIIDKNYRGEIIVKVDNDDDYPFLMETGKCYFQIVAFDGNLPEFTIVNQINDTYRGEGGFGSTTD